MPNFVKSCAWKPYLLSLLSVIRVGWVISYHQPPPSLQRCLIWHTLICYLFYLLSRWVQLSHATNFLPPLHGVEFGTNLSVIFLICYPCGLNYLNVPTSHGPTTTHLTVFNYPLSLLSVIHVGWIIWNYQPPPTSQRCLIIHYPCYQLSTRTTLSCWTDGGPPRWL